MSNDELRLWPDEWPEQNDYGRGWNDALRHIQKDTVLALTRTPLPRQHGAVIEAQLALGNWQKYNGEPGDEIVYQAEKVATALSALLALFGQQGASPSPLLSEPSFCAGADHAPSSGTRDGGGASAEDVERVARAIDEALPDRARPYNREVVARAAIDAFNGDAK